MIYIGRMADAHSAHYAFYACPYRAAGGRSNRDIPFRGHGEYDTYAAGAPTRTGGLLGQLASSLYSVCGLTAVAVASLVDGETFTIDNGERSAVFEFDVNGTGVGPGNVRVNVSALTTAAEVAGAIAAAINTSTPWLCYAFRTGPDDTQIDLINQVPGARGLAGDNVDSVANAGFVLNDFAGVVELLPERWGKNYALHSTRSSVSAELPHELA